MPAWKAGQKRAETEAFKRWSRLKSGHWRSGLNFSAEKSGFSLCAGSTICTSKKYERGGVRKARVFPLFAFIKEE